MKMKMSEGADCRDESGIFCFNLEFGLIDDDDDDLELRLVVVVCVIRDSPCLLLPYTKTHTTATATGKFQRPGFCSLNCSSCGF